MLSLSTTSSRASAQLATVTQAARVLALLISHCLTGRLQSVCVTRNQPTGEWRECTTGLPGGVLYDKQQLVQHSWQPALRHTEGEHRWVQQDIVCVTGSLQSVAANCAEVGRESALLVMAGDELQPAEQPA